ncbi:YrzE family protein [Halostagnicola bangensis]
MRRSLVIGIVLLAVAFLFLGGPSLLFSPSTSDIAPEEEDQPRPEVHSFEDADSGIWPYLSSREHHDKRSPLNIIVRGDSEDVVQLLTEESDGDWEEIDEDEMAAEDEPYAFLENDHHHATGTEWGEAVGTTRYAWVDPGPGEDPHWTTETLQLDDGDYYGERMHIRLYEAPNSDDEWVAMQAHTEHFDWFTLRHRVDGVERAQLEIESEFMELPGVDSQEDVQRINLDNSGPSDADGWTTVVDLFGMVLVPFALGLASQQRVRERTPNRIDERLTDVDRRRLAAAYDRIEAGHLVLSMSILAMFLGVRIGGIALERTIDALTMHMIAAMLYPVIAVGIPVVTYLVAHGLTRRLDAAVAASGSLILAIWLDYGLMSVDSLPVDVVAQRMLVVVALGLIAGGAAKRATRESWLNDLLVAGVAMWVLVLGGTLFGYF